jgi:hypothetical protein
MINTVTKRCKEPTVGADIFYNIILSSLCTNIAYTNLAREINETNGLLSLGHCAPSNI